MSTQVTLFEAIVLSINNLNKIVVKTNIFNCCLSIALLSYLSFVITIIFNIRTLLTSYIKIINIINLSKTFSNNNSNRNYRNLLKLFYSLTNNLYFLKKMRSIRQIKINNYILCVQDFKQAKKDLLIKKKTIIIANSRIAIHLIIDLCERTLSRNIKRIKTIKLRKSFTTMSKTTIIIISQKIFNTINYTISLSTITRYLVFLLY